jgi:predicted transposase YdaD
MSKYDKIFKENVEAIYLALSKRFIDNSFYKTEELSTDIQSTKEKKTDFLRKMLYSDPANNFILHVELQTNDDANMIYRMQEYHAMLVRKYKMRVVQLVLYFGKGISKMTNSYNDGRNSFSFELISIQEFSYRSFLDTDKPEELTLAILADFENLSEMEITNLIFARAKIITNETFGMEKFVVQLEVLSKLRNLDFFIQQFVVNYMALELKIEDSFIYKRGKKEGKLEGKKAGKKEGKLEGKIEGEKSKRDQMILALLKKGKFSHEDIAEAAEVSIEYVEELANNLKK